ncbi:MAG: ABC transporter permease, partial [Chitinophagaceae bacterium]
INILGLSLSMSVCLVALLQIKDAYNYDAFHPFPKRSYRIITDLTAENGMKERWATSPLPLAEKLSADYPFIEKTVHVTPGMDEELIYKEKTIPQKVAFTEPSFFDVFGFELIAGNKKTALELPNSIVLSQQASTLIFADEDPIGKIISFNNKEAAFTVTGILKDTQKKSHLVADMYASVSSIGSKPAGNLPNLSLQDWKTYSNYRTYVLLKENTPASFLRNALATISQKNSSLFSVKNIRELHYDYQRLDRISPGEALINSGNGIPGSSLWVISGITLVILLMACFNYTNLSLARSLSRAREVGVRKAIGGSRRQIFYQFIIESVTVSLFALIIAVLMLQFLMKFPVVRDRFLSNIYLDTGTFIWFVVFALVTGLIAGALPAAILSSFKPVQVLKNLSSVRIFKGLALRKTLIVLQFGISLVFIIFLVTVYKQLSFTASYEYGFNEENIINLKLPGTKREILKEEITRIAGVEKVSASSSVFGFHGGEYFPMKKNREEKGMGTVGYFIDENFISNFGLTMVAGRNFTKSDAPSFRNIILNETAVKNLQFDNPEKILGEYLWLNDTSVVKVVGVVKDFNYSNLKRALGNLALCFDTARYDYLNVKVTSGDRKTMTGSMQKVWQKTYPGTVFNYSWYDQQLADSRNKTDDFSMISFLAFMAVSIACMGLLAMVTYTSEIRQKEVSVRKVMGARTSSIVLLLSKNFIWLLLISSAISLPVGYMIGNNFLQKFAYRVTMGWPILSTSVLFILVIGMLTIASQTYRIAAKNPARNLRTE